MMEVHRQFKGNSMFIPLGIPTAHSWIELGCILSIIEQFEINVFVELGIHKGGLGAILNGKTQYTPRFYYIGVEIKEEDIDPLFIESVDRNLFAEIIIGDVFRPEMREAIRLKTNERLLIYCDNGDKSREVPFYAEILHPGDLIMVHDHPKEFSDEDIVEAEKTLTRIHLDYMEGTRLVLFQK